MTDVGNELSKLEILLQRGVCYVLYIISPILCHRVFITLVLVEGLGVLREGLVCGEFPSSPGSCCSCLPTPILCFSALCLVFPTKHCHLVMCELIFLFSCPWNFKSKNVTLMWLFEVAVWAPLKCGLCLSRPAADARPQVRQIQRLIILRGAAWCILSVCE